MTRSDAPPRGCRGAEPRRGVRRLAIATIGALVAAGCSTLTSPADPIGNWGGPHIALVVTATGATAEFDCAHGSFGPLTPASDGRFAATGVWVREHGGPVRDGEVLSTFPASYSGRIWGASMNLTVARTDSAVTIGTFMLTKGGAPAVFKCL